MKRCRGVVVLRQRHDWDCGLAALAMLIGVPYGDVAAFVRELLTAAVLDRQQVRRRGLGLRDMQIVADGFGVALRPLWRQAGYLDGRTGILGMLGGEMDPSGHWVVLKAGAIVDPSFGQVWSVADYVRAHHCRSATVLVEDT